jgi:predicted acetyltransferase
LLVLARGHGLPFVDLTTDADNLPSQKVITANGGVLEEHFTKAAMYGGAASLRFRITLV